MKIDIIVNDGSPLGVHLDDVAGYGDRFGVGGAELYLLTLCELWTKFGYSVRLYNNPTRQTSPFEQLQVSDFDPQEDRDVLIIFRSPNPATIGAKGLKIWLSCDQYTVGPSQGLLPN